MDIGKLSVKDFCNGLAVLDLSSCKMFMLCLKILYSTTVCLFLTHI